MAKRKKTELIESSSTTKQRFPRNPEQLDESFQDLNDPLEISRAAAVAAADRMSDRRMPLYARTAALNPVLDAASERELARVIADGAAELWAVALADRHGVGRDRLRGRAHRERRPCPGLRGGRRRQGARRQDGSARHALRKAAEKASRRLVELDPDDEVIDQLVARLREAQTHPESALRGLGRVARAPGRTPLTWSGSTGRTAR